MLVANRKGSSQHGHLAQARGYPLGGGTRPIGSSLVGRFPDNIGQRTANSH